ncbi:MAG: alpha/beta hydrolase [Anaerolineae bacterium]
MALHDSTVHPELRHKLPQFSFNARNLWWLRKLVTLQRPAQMPSDVGIENIFIPSLDQPTQIRVRVYRPRSLSAPAPILLWLHGGGFVIGKPEMDEATCSEYARTLGLVVVSVDYRYAPEHPFPTALNDGYAALTWVADHAAPLGVDVRRLAIGGQSAGGGLAAALVQFAHDRAEIKPVFQLLIYPMLDDRTVVRTDIVNRGNLMWNQASNRFGWESYLQQPCGLDEVPDYAVPSRRADLAGLPPAWLGVGTLDLFYDEDVAYARRLNESGAACELVVVPGAYHGFDVVTPRATVVRDFRHSQLAALRKHLLLGS